MGQPAFFYYKADKIGPETLVFLVTMPQPMEIESIDAATNARTVTRIDIFSDIRHFEVVDCVYKVSMLFKGQPVPNDIYTGILPETRLAMNDQGYYEGDGQLEFHHIVLVEGCTTSTSGFD